MILKVSKNSKHTETLDIPKSTTIVHLYNILSIQKILQILIEILEDLKIILNDSKIFKDSRHFKYSIEFKGTTDSKNSRNYSKFRDLKDWNQYQKY